MSEAHADEAILEDLVALIKNELSPEREAEVRAAVDQDPKLQAELESLRATFKSSAHVGLIEPSAEFRKNLQDRIQASLEQKRRGDRMKRPGSTAVTLPRAPSGRAATPSSGTRAPTGSKSSQRRALTEAPASSRVLRLPERRPDYSGRSAFRFMAMAAALVVTALTLSYFIDIPAGEEGATGDPVTLALKHWNQRREATTWETILKGDRVEVAEAAPADTLYLLNHSASKFKEDFVVAYSDADLGAMEKKIGKKRLDALMESSLKVTVENGQLVLPPGMVSRLGGSGQMLTILNASGRMEIWNKKKFDSYLQAEPTLEAVPAPGKKEQDAKPGLPPEADLTPDQFPAV